MELTRPLQPLLIAVIGFVVAALVAILVFRMLRAAWPLVSDDITRARLRRVNVCFALFGALVLAASWALAQPWERGQGASALVGIFFAVPVVCIAGPIALYNSVLLWRVTSVRILWIISLLFVLVILVEERLGPSLSAIVDIVYALLIIALAIRGLTKGRRSGRARPDSEAV